MPVTPGELCRNEVWFRVPWGRVTLGREKGMGDGGSEEAAWRRWLWPGAWRMDGKSPARRGRSVPSKEGSREARSRARAWPKQGAAGS